MQFAGPSEEALPPPPPAPVNETRGAKDFSTGIRGVVVVVVDDEEENEDVGLTEEAEDEGL